jgi:hypothetical protein
MVPTGQIFTTGKYAIEQRRFVERVPCAHGISRTSPGVRASGYFVKHDKGVINPAKVGQTASRKTPPIAS